MPLTNVESQSSMWCPRCDKLFDSLKNRAETLKEVKVHVAGQHPDHDPEWWDTYPTDDN